MLSRIQFVKTLGKVKIVNLLALDIGTRFIGVAVVQDAFGTGVPYPVTTIDRSKCDFVKEIDSQLSEIHGIVVGMPTSPDFQDFIHKAVSLLTLRIHLPFVSTNENFSSFEAARLLKKINPGYAQNKFLYDQVAACIILNTFIMQGKETIRTLPKPIGYKID